jgi:uncharacterized repeat protein (TIGR01451 family)
MKTSVKIAAAGITGVAMAASFATPALAWHPKGQIIKYVTNQTAGGAMSDANDAAHGVTAKQGDVLKYTIVVSNIGDAASNGYNDMAKTKLTDTLPAGVELVSDASKHDITEDLGTIKPGQKVTKEYVVKVTSDKEKDVITNKACFTGDSTANDNPQSGCDNAVVTVVNEKPQTPPTTPEQPKPETPAPEQPAPEVLPNTGVGAIAVPAGIVSILGYAGNMLRIKRKNKN